MMVIKKNKKSIIVKGYNLFFTLFYFDILLTISNIAPMCQLTLRVLVQY